MRIFEGLLAPSVVLVRGVYIVFDLFGPIVVLMKFVAVSTFYMCVCVLSQSAAQNEFRISSAYLNVVNVNV